MQQRPWWHPRIFTYDVIAEKVAVRKGLPSTDSELLGVLKRGSTIYGTLSRGTRDRGEMWVKLMKCSIASCSTSSDPIESAFVLADGTHLGHGVLLQQRILKHLDYHPYRVVFRVVAVRAAPWTGGSVLASLRRGEVVSGRLHNVAGEDWLCLHKANREKLGVSQNEAWVLAEGASVGLGQLLEKLPLDADVYPSRYIVAHPHVRVRNAPSMDAPAVEILEGGWIVHGAKCDVDGAPWLRLSQQARTKLGFNNSGEAWVLIHGSIIGLGPLLIKMDWRPTPRLVKRYWKAPDLKSPAYEPVSDEVSQKSLLAVAGPGPKSAEGPSVPEAGGVRRRVHLILNSMSGRQLELNEWSDSKVLDVKLSVQECWKVPAICQVYFADETIMRNENHLGAYCQSNETMEASGQSHGDLPYEDLQISVAFRHDELTSLLTSKDADDRCLAVRTLTLLFPDGSEELIGSLCSRMMFDPAPVVRIASLRELVRLREQVGIELFSTLVLKALEDTDSSVRQVAASVIGSFAHGHESAQQFSRLRYKISSLLSDKEEPVGRAVLASLQKEWHGTDRIERTLRGYVSGSPQPWLAMALVEDSQNCRLIKEEVITVFSTLLLDVNAGPPCHKVAYDALAHMCLTGSGRLEVATVLTKELQNADISQRRRIVSILLRLMPNDHGKALASLQGRLASESAETRSSASQRLLEIFATLQSPP
eukprot:TRINITY_DN9717_c0_g1_i1.p1 TRINITY_DN9717_c0_g1~~TRINITY_DN9717_c0_g1_i1.p1  ORF type:complete len:714 (-),score=86.31 TRINITY_DN9717_c0_g1_i1:134-2248(-)